MAVHIKRVIHAPIQRVFQAWTDPKELKLWHAPEPVEITKVISDNHVGGTRAMTLVIDGKTYQIAGTYAQFDPPNKLVYNWEDPLAPNGSITTVLFTRLADDQTEVEVTYTNPTVGSAQQGLILIMNRLERYLN